RVGVVPEVGALVDEALAVRVDHDPERVAVLLEVVADRQVAELRGVEVPAHGVAARPVPDWARADLEGHAVPVTRVVLGAAHLGEVPRRTEVPRPPLGVGLESATGQDDRVAALLAGASILADDDTVDA